MNLTAPSIHRWPAEAAQLLAEPALLMAALETDSAAKRAVVRHVVREAALEILARKLNVPAGRIRLLAPAGQALSLGEPYHKVGISFSHEVGCSLIAIDLNGPVGIDLLALPANPGWQADAALLAKDYLGPDVSKELGQAPPNQLFAAAWARHEAALKCLGLALTEWTPALARRLATVHSQDVQLRGAFCAAVAQCRVAVDGEACRDSELPGLQPPQRRISTTPSE